MNELPGSKTASSPASPSRLDPGLPVHITLYRTELDGSASEITSTTCPRFKRKLPRNLKPPCELSTTRQGSLSARPLRVMIKLAREVRLAREARLLHYRGLRQMRANPWPRAFHAAR